jgi:hypothetical protein
VRLVIELRASGDVAVVDVVIAGEFGVRRDFLRIVKEHGVVGKAQGTAERGSDELDLLVVL